MGRKKDRGRREVAISLGLLIAVEPMLDSFGNLVWFWKASLGTSDLVCESARPSLRKRS